MTWKKVSNADPGDADHFGGNDIDKISDLFSGVSDVDTVDLNSLTTFRNQKLRIRNPANTFSYIVNSGAITSDRSVSIPLLTANDTFVFAGLAQTISNKVFTGFNLDSSTNTFKGFAQDPLGRRWGLYQPLTAGTTNATVGTLQGMLSGHAGFGAGTPSNTWDTTEGLLINHITGTTVGDRAGVSSPGTAPGLLKITAGATIRVRCAINSTSSSRMYFGVSTANVLPVSDTPLATTDAGIIVGFNTADGTFTARGNDASGSATSYSLGTARNTSFNTFEINWPGSGAIGPVNIMLNGTEVTEIAAAADLPDELDNLFFHFQIQTNTTAAKTIAIKGIWIDSA